MRDVSIDSGVDRLKLLKLRHRLYSLRSWLTTTPLLLAIATVPFIRDREIGSVLLVDAGCALVVSAWVGVAFAVYRRQQRCPKCDALLAGDLLKGRCSRCGLRWAER